MQEKELLVWLDCDDEMKMDDFITNIDDQICLRRFSMLNAESIEAHLIDPRSRDAIVIAEAYLCNEKSLADLENAYRQAVKACEQIESAHMSEYDPTPSEEVIEYSALVAAWAAFPEGYAGTSQLVSAQQSALHTAYYCFKIDGRVALKQQLGRFRDAGLFV